MKQFTLQRRQHPIFSPLALLSTLILVIGLSLGVFVKGGSAFSPGDLSAVNNSGQAKGGFMNHAEFGNGCTQCHGPFTGVEAERCETCHENVGQQRKEASGLHGRLENVEKCTRCHLDHRGHEYDLTTDAIANFDHELTGFSLRLHEEDYNGRTLNCASCHQDETNFAVDTAKCEVCHTDDAPEFMAVHTDAFGSDCVSCHDGYDSTTDYTIEDHAQVFVLVGAHATTSCEDCHAGGQFQGISQECVACHSEPASHQGLFGTDCAQCHSEEGWQPATLEGSAFNHNRDTRFSLVNHVVNYDDTEFSCRTCHINEGDFSFADNQCTDCHSTADPDFMVQHIAQFGEDCLACHDGTGEMANFDHNSIWPLDGKHAAIECTACHVNRVFKGTPTECVDCHQEPAIHAGLFGTDCAKCHTAQAWQPARLSEHSFPLNHGGRGEIPCETCHVSKYTEYTCYNCHEHDKAKVEREHREEGISPAELANCVECHPTGRENEGRGRGGDD